jgi:sec-independent protein translocase protein TatC
MPPTNDDDLFQHTSMTFGEHLEELRVALFKAVLALVIGFGIGLFFASPIVRAIEAPLHSALVDFYQRKAFDQLSGELPPDLLEDEPTRKALRKLIYDDGLMPEERFVAPGSLLEMLRERYPDTFREIQLPADKPAQNEDSKQTAAGQQADAEPKADEQPAEKAQEALATAPPQFSKERMVRLLLWRPLADDERLKLDALGVQEPFVIYIKAGFLAGAVISSPFVFYFLWQFVAAGLYPHEKKYIHVFLPFSLALFLSGAALAFFFVFPPVLNFFFNIAESLGTEMRPRLTDWLSFVLLLPLGFGVSFQLPLVMLFLNRINVFSVDMYLSKWRIAVLVMAIASMLLSPGGDPYSMLMMLIPLVGLYFAGVGLCKWMPSRKGPTVRPA